MSPKKLNIPTQTTWLVSGLSVLSLLFGCASVNDLPDYAEYDIETLQVLMQQGQLSSLELTQYYLDKIDAVDRNGSTLNSIIDTVDAVQ